MDNFLLRPRITTYVSKKIYIENNNNIKCQQSCGKAPFIVDEHENGSHFGRCVIFNESEHTLTVIQPSYTSIFD